jgi:hypothetical integral membrane protein (TIGR02206 family)
LAPNDSDRSLARGPAARNVRPPAAHRAARGGTIGRTLQQWSPEHLGALGFTAVVAAALVVGARAYGDAWSVPAGRALGVVIAAGFLCEQITYALRGDWTAKYNLPLQLTDAVTLVSIAALWRPDRRLLVELVYFWAFSASLQAIVTPDLNQAFPDVLCFTYFATHSGAIAAAALLVFGTRRTPRPRAVWRTYAATAAFACLAAAGTLLTGGNYMFLRRKPVHGSLLDRMGPWPVYILAGALLGLVMFMGLAALTRPITPRGDPSKAR